MPITVKNSDWRRGAQMCVLALSTTQLLGIRCIAQSKLICHPAVESTMAIGTGSRPLPGGSPLSTYALTEAQGSACGLSIGGSSSRGADDLDQRLFGSLTHTIGYADLSGGFVYSETKVRTYFGDGPNSTIIR